MLDRIKQLFKRINQVILAFPVWLTLGVSGALQSFDQGGWIEDSEESDYGRMY